MDSSGKFSAPVRMDTNINTVSNETSPVVFKGIHTFISSPHSSTNTYITFISSLGASTNVVTYILDTDFGYTSTTSSFSTNAVHLGLKNKYQYDPALILASGTGNWEEISWAILNGDWGTGAGLGISNLSAIYGTDGYHEGITNWVEKYLFCVRKGSKYQLYAGYTDYLGANQSASISAYSSGYNDKDPCIDLETLKVYFASDRNGKGTLICIDIM